jgi:hypothetical protein
MCVCVCVSVRVMVEERGDGVIKKKEQTQKRA